MSSKGKTILLTVVGTSGAWALAIAAIILLQPERHLKLGNFWFHSATGGCGIVTVAPSGVPSSVEWVPLEAAFRVELVSSNTMNAGVTPLYSGTSRPPERIWFKTAAMEPEVIRQ